MNSKDLQKQYTEEYEEQVLLHLDLKLELLKKEKKIKQSADFTPMEPAYKYEGSPAWIEYLQDVAMHNIFQNELAISKQRKDLKLKALERKELEELKNESEVLN